MSLKKIILFWYNIKMFEITIDNYHKCDLETIIDPNNRQDFWINRRDLEIETKRNWKVIFNKCKDSSKQKYGKELTPNIIFQPNEIFERNNLFEKIIKSCKRTNLEDICDEQELVSISGEIFKEENFFTQLDVENKQLKEENEKLRKKENEKLRKENEQSRKDNVIKDAEIKESIEKPKDINSLEEDENTTDSYPNLSDKNKFEKLLAIIDSNTFSYKNKIGVLRYIDIKDLVNNIKNNTISEISAKKRLNTLNETKNAEIIKHKRRTSGQNYQIYSTIYQIQF